MFERVTCTYVEGRTQGSAGVGGAKDESCETDIWTVNAGGGGERLLTRKPSGEGQDAAWSPDGRRIAFVGGVDLWLMNPDGSGQKRLTQVGFEDDPAWSPDGRRIAFAGGPEGDDLLVMNADGTGKRRLTSMPAVQDLVWSPDGRRIAFSYGGNAIYVINADGTKRRRLADATGAPAWSPDGRRIAFDASSGVDDNGISNSDVFVIGVNGVGLRRLTDNLEIDRYPSWSPDGRRILFVSQRLGNYFRLYVMKADGTGQRRVTRDNGGNDDSNWGEDDPAWSPDGRRIAYELGSGVDTRDGIYVINADGTGQRKVAQDTCACEGPIWQPSSGQRR